MRFPTATSIFLSLASVFLPTGNAEQILRSNSLATCQESNGFTASLFNFVFTPNNNTALISLIATSTIEGHVLFDVAISAYGYQIVRTTINPCDIEIGLCPMAPGEMIPPPFNLPITKSAAAQIPGIAYMFPDLDATVRVYVNMTSGPQAGQRVACLEADISNGKTVDLVGVKWATAAIAGLALLSSAVVSGLGYSNAASHVAANALSLFGYFQAQAMIGLCAVPLPPVVASWTQDFQWSMGIINVGFIQDILTWYQRATGGTATLLLDSLHAVSVQVEKRGLPAIEPTVGVVKRAAGSLAQPVVARAVSIVKRANLQTSFGSYIVFGIQRVAFRAKIETTNLFLTGLTFFYIFTLFAALGVVLFRGFCEVAWRTNIIKSDKFEDFRKGWLTMLKGILYRVTLIGFPQIVIFCLWELTQNDSPAAMVLAVFFFFGMTLTLGWASFKVIRMARRSVALHRNPAYILFSDPQSLNKWGFLYVQFRASAYYFIVPVLFYIMVKGMFIGLAQRSGITQAIALIILETAALITASVMRPWMDKSTNSFNIAICSMNFVNAILLFVFTDVFTLPPLVIGVVGVVFWIANAAFALILLLMLIITTGIVLFHNNPDTRYQTMNDDRASFMASKATLGPAGELDALAATARNSGRGYKPALDLDDDNESAMSNPANFNGARPSSVNSGRHSMRSMRQMNVDPSYPLPNHEHGELKNRASSHFRTASPLAPNGSTSNLSGGPHSQHNVNAAVGYKNPNASPWQRGAGYD